MSELSGLPPLPDGLRSAALGLAVVPGASSALDVAYKTPLSAAAGAPGAAGLGIVSGAVNSSGHLILTLSDASTRDVGAVVGAPGTPGAPGAPGSGGTLAAPGQGNTVTTLSQSGLIYAFDAGAGKYIAVTDMLNVFGARLFGAEQSAAPMLGPNKIWINQGGASDVIGTLDQLLSFVQAHVSGGAGKTITLTAPSGATSGAPYAITGALSGYTDPPRLKYAVDGGPFTNAGDDAVISTSAFSIPAPALTAGAHTVEVQEQDAVAFTVATPAPPTITVNLPSGWEAGGSGAIGGAYSGTAPTGVSIVYDSDTSYVETTAFSASNNAWAGTVTYPGAGSHTITVREDNAHDVTATSASFTVAAPEPGLLDTITATVKGAYALRKLRAGYAGSAIRVRRSSDSTERDIGFVSGSLDTASLLAFCGSGDGLVSKWYDQSGLAQDTVQAVAAQQPKIVSAGAVTVMPNSTAKPAMQLAGSPQQFLVNESFALGGTAAAAFSVMRLDAVQANSYCRTLGFAASGSRDNQPSGVVFGYYHVGELDAQSGGVQAAAIGFSSTSPVQIASVFDGSVSVLTVDGAMSASTPASTSFAATGTLGLGSGENFDQSWTGAQAEHLVISGSVSGADQAAIRASQKTYYGTPADPLILTNATFGAGDAPFGQMLTGGSGVSSAPLASPDGAFTVEFRFMCGAPSGYSPKSLLGNAAGARQGNSIGVNGQGHLEIVGGGSGLIGGGPNICDGVTRHVAFVATIDSGGNYTVTAYVDGAVAFTSFTVPRLSGLVYVRSDNFGQMQDLRISSVARYPGAFTPPAAPFVPDSATVALWPLDGNGASV